MRTLRSRRPVWALLAVLTLLGAACSGGGGSAERSASNAAPTPSAASAEPGAGAAPGAAPSPDPSAAGTPDGATTAAPADGGMAATPAGAPNGATPNGPGANGTGLPGRPALSGAAASPTGKAAAGGGPAAGSGATGAASPGPSGGTGGTGGSAAPAPAAATPGAPPPGGPAENFGSDVGVTKDTIKLGIINFASASRSLGPAIAQSTEKVTDALVRHINETGGVAGRKLQLVTCDDGGDLTRARACYEKLKSQVFAFVPSETWITDTIHDTLAKDKVPWLTWGWFKSEYEDRYMFPCHANGLREAKAMAKWVATTLRPKTVGLVYLNVSEDIAARDEARKVFEAAGIKVVKEIAQEWDSPDESQHVLAMRAANPEHVLAFTWPAPLAKFFHDARAQNWAPPAGYSANHLTGDPGYGQLFTDYIKEKVYTITSWMIQKEDTPELAEFRDVVTRAYGKELLGIKFRYALGHHLSQSAWVCTKAFAKAAGALGPNLTRAGLIRQLESQPYDSGMGVTLTWAPGDHSKPPYSFNREFIYKWVGHRDGGWDLNRIMPDALYEG